MATCNICGKTVEPLISFPTGTKVCNGCARAHGLALPSMPADENIILAPESRIYMLDRDLSFTGAPSEPADVAHWRDEWTRFCKEVFREDVDLSDIRIPLNPGGYDWVLFLLPWMTQNRLWTRCKDAFGGHSYLGDDLDKVVPTHERKVTDGAYAIRIRPNAEVDEELKNRSAIWINQQKRMTMTLPERLVLEPWYSWKFNDHLDRKNITLCAGSRSSGGRVPSVDWRGGGLCVRGLDPDDSRGGLRARAAVS